MRGREGKRQEWGGADKTSAGFAHLCQAERARPAVTGRRRRREGLRGGGRRERKEGGTLPTSTSARNCFRGKCIIMKAGVGWKSAANAKIPQETIKVPLFFTAGSHSRLFFIPVSLCFHTSFQMIFSPKKSLLFSSLTVFQRDLANVAPEAQLC